jgi:hypothetical protein
MATFRTSHGLLLGQLGLATVGIGAAWAMPPHHGPMLLLPLTSAAAGRTAQVAVDGGARLLARGPTPGSLVVEGDSARLVGLIGEGILVMRAPPAGCGAAATGAAA